MGLPVHLCGRGGAPAGLPCGSQIPTYSSLGVRSLRDLDHHVTACSEGAKACWGGGVLGLLSVRPHFCWGGGGGSKRSAPLFPGPQGEPAHGLHPRFVVAEIWADRGAMGGGGGGVWFGLGQGLCRTPWPMVSTRLCADTTGLGESRLSGPKACRTVDRPRTPWWHTREGDAAVPVCVARAGQEGGACMLVAGRLGGSARGGSRWGGLGWWVGGAGGGASLLSILDPNTHSNPSLG